MDREVFCGRRIVVIAACDDEFGIGKAGRIPWNVPEDRAFFKRQTMGNAVLMGRRTFESIPGGGLSGRLCVVLQHQACDAREGVVFVDDVDTGVARCFSYSNTIYVAGGGEVYRELMPYATDILLSRVAGDWNCDVFFPKLGADWRLERRVPFSAFCLEIYRKKVECSV